MRRSVHLLLIMLLFLLFQREGFLFAAPTPEQIESAKALLKQQAKTQKPLGGSVANKQRSPAQLAQEHSAFEAYIQGQLPSTVSTELKQFGYDLFRTNFPTTFAPAEIIPVGPGYLLGTDDELRISIWGKVNAEYTVLIDREGKITLPQTGILYLSGLTFSEAKEFLKKELSRYYKRGEVEINMSMGRLRTIRVFMVGKASWPGSYTLSSLSTLVHALFEAGGPTKIGTMRDIQVKRSGKTIAHFDLYDFLLKGDKTMDIRLMPEDVVFIPTIGPLAGIAGSVRSPAIYELKGETSLTKLIEMAGGLSDIAFTGRVQIERIIDNNRQVAFEANLTEVKTKDIKIQPGDLIKIFSVVQDTRMVRLTGSVHREGEYAYTPGMNISDLISMAGGLKYYAYTRDAELTRITPTDAGPRTTKLIINLQKAIDGDLAHNISLKEEDYLFVRAVPEWELYRTVSINGEIRFAGSYTIKKGESLSSLIERAGGFTNNAYLKGAVFTRESVKELQQRQLDEAVDRLEQQILSQSAMTIETALTTSQAEQQKMAAGQRKALIAKLRAAKAKGRININLDTLDKFQGSPSDVVLEEGDTLIIPGKSIQVQVIGSVYNQNAFVYNPKTKLSAYLKKAGGFTRNADKKEVYVLKVDGTAISKRANFGFAYMRLDPGDTIVVPEKIDKIAWLREVKDMTQILYQIAVTAGVLIVAF